MDSKDIYNREGIVISSTVLVCTNLIVFSLIFELIGVSEASTSTTYEITMTFRSLVLGYSGKTQSHKFIESVLKSEFQVRVIGM